MKIIRFAAENFMKLKAFDVTLDPERNILTISGKNGQGKTSALSIITAAIGGKKLRPDKPIRDGEKSGFAEVEMDAYTARVDFKLRDNGTVYETLTLKTKDEAKFTSAQSMLDKIIGDLSFDPLKFMRMDQKTQRDILVELADINFDFEKNAKERKDLYDDRTSFNRQLKQKEGELVGAEQPDPKYVRDEYSILELINKLSDANRNNQEYADLSQGTERAKSEIPNVQKEIDDLNIKIDSKKKEIANINDFIKENTTLLDRSHYIETEEIKLAINHSEEINKKIRHAKQQKCHIENTKEWIDKFTKEVMGKTHEIDKKDDDKRDALIRAKFPIKGLTVDENKVFWNTIPLKQTSHSEQLEISISIAMAKNPKLPIILITDGSLLDSEHMEIIDKLAEKYGFNVILEMVDQSEEGKHSPIGIVIENGEIIKDNYKNPPKDLITQASELMKDKTDNIPF